MRKTLPILIVAALVATVVAVATYRISCRVAVSTREQPADDLEWFRLEFHLSDAELARVRALHDGYRPQCEFHCVRIADAKERLQQLQNGKAAPDQIDAQQRLVASVRAECQAAMLVHFETVSQAMPADQGRRYLAEMRRITLARHEEVETSMADAHRTTHGHH